MEKSIDSLKINKKNENQIYRLTAYSPYEFIININSMSII